MKSNFWKIYLWFLLFTIFSVIIGLFYDAGKHIVAFITDTFFITVSTLSVYSYIYKKNYFSLLYWKIFFWLNIVYYIFSIIYSLAPDTYFTKYLSVFSQTGKPVPLIDAIIGVLFPIPLLYTAYQMSKGKFLNSKAKTKVKSRTKNNLATPRWNIFKTALWGYSTIFMSIVLLTLFFPSGNSSGPSDSLYGIIVLAPVAAFWLAVVVKYKQYRWNWWKRTLVLNSLVYVGIIIFGMFFLISSHAKTVSTGISYFNIVEEIIMISSLIILGRERLKQE